MAAADQLQENEKEPGAENDTNTDANTLANKAKLEGQVASLPEASLGEVFEDPHSVKASLVLSNGKEVTYSIGPDGRALSRHVEFGQDEPVYQEEDSYSVINPLRGGIQNLESDIEIEETFNKNTTEMLTGLLTADLGGGEQISEEKIAEAKQFDMQLDKMDSLEHTLAQLVEEQKQAEARGASNRDLDAQIDALKYELRVAISSGSAESLLHKASVLSNGELFMLANGTIYKRQDMVSAFDGRQRFSKVPRDFATQTLKKDLTDSGARLVKEKEQKGKLSKVLHLITP